jgi:protein-disulfide isomerase
MTAKRSNRFIVFVILGVIAAAAGLGYYSNSLKLSDSNASSATAAEAATDTVSVTPFDPSALALQEDDIILGKATAPVTIIEYSSLSCPHCAHFHEEILPEVKKAVIDTGKAKLVIRPFPLNLPALRASVLVQCAPQTKRAALLETLYQQQKDWAFTPAFLNQLKAIGAANGIDAAQFDACMKDVAIESAILNSRKTAMEKLHVESTPSFFIQNAPVEMKDGLSAAAIITAVEQAKK